VARDRPAQLTTAATIAAEYDSSAIAITTQLTRSRVEGHRPTSPPSSFSRHSSITRYLSTDAYWSLVGGHVRWPPQTTGERIIALSRQKDEALPARDPRRPWSRSTRGTPHRAILDAAPDALRVSELDDSRAASFRAVATSPRLPDPRRALHATSQPDAARESAGAGTIASEYWTISCVSSRDRCRPSSRPDVERPAHRAWVTEVSEVGSLDELISRATSSSSSTSTIPARALSPVASGVARGKPLGGDAPSPSTSDGRSLLDERTASDGAHRFRSRRTLSSGAESKRALRTIAADGIGTRR